ncbi:MAG: hypothetical protein JZD41_08440 [Thermoproteus sp.]|nr:hypothetical protein [Thermoproteus sp.]
MSRKDRVNIAVAVDVAQRLARVSDSTGVTQFALANDLLTLGLDMMDEGYNISQMRELARFWRVCLDVEAVPVPAKLLDRLITKFYSQHGKELEELWCEAGRSLAAYFKAMAGGGLREAMSLLPYLVKMLPARRFDVRLEDGAAILCIVGVGYSKETVLVNAAGARCFFEAFGFKVVELEAEPGILFMKAVPTAEAGPIA